MNVEFINPFLQALLEVTKTMAQTELKPGKPRLKTNEVAQGDVSGLIGMVGPQTRGSLSVTFESRLALQLLYRMVGERRTEVDDQVSDMVGEITNMVSGSAKNALSDKGFEFEMATPVVVTGKRHTLNHRATGPKIIMPFESDFGAAYIEICFDH